MLCFLNKELFIFNRSASSFKLLADSCIFIFNMQIFNLLLLYTELSSILSKMKALDFKTYYDNRSKRNWISPEPKRVNSPFEYGAIQKLVKWDFDGNLNYFIAQFRNKLWTNFESTKLPISIIYRIFTVLSKYWGKTIKAIDKLTLANKLIQMRLKSKINNTKVFKFHRIRARERFTSKEGNRL